MTQITSMTGPVSSLRAQLRAQAEAALGTDANKSQFTERAYPDHHVRIVGYDAYTQSQGSCFVVFEGR
jgi:hypothetical protein